MISRFHNDTGAGGGSLGFVSTNPKSTGGVLPDMGRGLTIFLTFTARLILHKLRFTLCTSRNRASDFFSVPKTVHAIALVAP